MIDALLKIILGKRIKEFQVYLRQPGFKGVMLRREEVEKFIILYEEALKVLSTVK